MTIWDEVKDDPKYTKVLDKGFVGLIDHMGSDSAIVQAARVSYGSGTKTVREDRGLIRYLIRNRHTSPVEMCEIKLHIKLPIFVFRQMVRHRTASLNEYSGRYSVMTDEFYIPEAEQIKNQSTINKQGRADPVSITDAVVVQERMRDNSHKNYDLYMQLLGNSDHEEFSNEFEGIARESARTVLPLNNYTELYWKQNLHNILHLLKLRMDSHAQWEIQEYAKAIYYHVESLFPLAVEAFEDYVNQSITLSRMEVILMKELINSYNPRKYLEEKLIEFSSTKLLAENYGISERELKEFLNKWI